MVEGVYIRNKINKNSINHQIQIPEFVEREIPDNIYTKRHILKFLYPYIFPKDFKLRMAVFSTAGLLVASKSLNAGVPFILKEAVNTLGTSMGYATILFGTYALARIAVILTQEYKNAIFSRVVLNAVKDVSSRVFWHLHSLDYTYHLESTKTTLFAVGRSMKGVENFLRFMMMSIIPTTLEFMIASGILLKYCGWPYLLTFGGTVATYWVFTTRYSTYRQDYIKEVKRKRKAVDFVINESFLNYEAVKCFTNEKLESDRYNHFLKQQMQAAVKTSNSLSTLNCGQHIIFNTGLAINLLLAVAQVSAGTMTIGDIFLIQTMFLQLQFPLNFLGSVYRELNEAQLEIKDLFHIFNIKPKVMEPPNAQSYQYKGGKISIKNVTYGFEDRKVFNDLDIEIEPGTSNAIVGESGIGKSTLFRLLYRLLDPEKGSILIDDQDVKSLKLESLRKNIAMVPQNGNLFNDSVYYNIIYGNPEASFEDVVKVCKMVNIYDRIMDFEEKFETNVGELGCKLSGGERQRISLARCLLKNANIYFFDEFTSAVDSHNENLITNALKEKLKGKTTIFAAHRLPSITYVDKIFVLQGGKVREQGTHQELLDKNSYYRELWDKFNKQHDI
ncbi:unnamed protein product [Blepharisma stoltei]|uniref:Uncharacterized protein n=1 Tax=Blepharisma stoltei TaxID=1481888 RepID=A0AAU9IGM7_9CILI|nr:unnamed protein product [Blepharisma stoltei]